MGSPRIGQFNTTVNNDDSHDVRSIAFVGLDRAGKTTTVHRLSRGILINTRPTTGFNTETFTFLGLRFNVFDLGGQISYQIFWETLIPRQEAVVFFIDSADVKRLAQVRIALNKTLSLVRPDATIMILANKQDLPNALSVEDLKKALNIKITSKGKKLQFFPVSAKTGFGIYKAFQWLAANLQLDIGDQKCHLYGFYVYEKNVGVPLITSQDEAMEKSVLNIADPIIKQDPTIITALHSALGHFAIEMAESELITVRVKSRKTGQAMQIGSVGYKNLVCILVTSENDNNIVINALGEAILKIVHERFNLRDLDPIPEDFELSEIINIISPFLANVEELKASIEKESPPSDIEQDLISSSSPEKTEVISSDSTSIVNEFSETITHEPKNPIVSTVPEVKNFSSSLESVTMPKAEESGMKTYESAISILRERYHVKESTYRPNTPSPKVQNPSSSSSIATAEASKMSDASQAKEQNDITESDDDMFFFRMGVAERIKYLQERRSRLREK
ncbi:MAG: ADP-ribosylation factor family protein [Candidatus Hermodarchaeota archaeon]